MSITLQQLQEKEDNFADDVGSLEKTYDDTTSTTGQLINRAASATVSLDGGSKLMFQGNAGVLDFRLLWAEPVGEKLLRT